MFTKQSLQYSTVRGTQQFCRASSQFTGRARHTMSRRAMVSDILLVLAWAAAIPGLMWLGAAGGF